MKGSVCVVRALVLVIIALCGCSGCESNGSKVDPWEKTNRVMYDVNDNLDKFALKPLADGYKAVVPEDIRKLLANGFDNLGYFNVISNDFLQGKWEQGWSDTGRMVVNSTFGVAGIFDVGTVWGMPSHENDLGITLGIWGVEPGPYIMLPLFGPTTARDAPGIAYGIMANPLTWYNAGAIVTYPLNVLQAADGRARAEQEVRFRDQAAIDPYAFTRDAYLQYREGLIHGTSKPKKVDDSMYNDPDAETAPATRPATLPAENSK